MLQKQKRAAIGTDIGKCLREPQRWLTRLGYADQCLLWKVRFLFILTPWSYYSLAFCWWNADEIHNYCNCERLCKLVELGKGEGLWSMLQTATASTSHVFECWAATSLATNTGESQSVVPCGNDVNRSDLVRLIGLRPCRVSCQNSVF